MLKERYRRLMADIQPQDSLVSRTLEAAAGPTVHHGTHGLRLAAAAMCFAALALIAAFAFLTPPKDIVASNGELPSSTEDFLPLKSSILSDDLTISVSDVTLVNDSELSLILTVRGDKVDPFTYINVDYPHLLYLTGASVGHFDDYEDRQPHEIRYKFRIESQDRDILYTLGSYLELTVDRYTSGTTQTETVHEIDWSSMEFTPSETGELIVDRGSVQVVSGFGFSDEAIIDLGGGLVISGFGFTDEGWLTVQSRWSADLPEPTYAINWLSTDGTNDSATNLYMQGGVQYSDGNYIYYNQIFPVTQEELDGVHLVTHCILAGDIIEGEWTITVDLSHLTAK